MIMMALDHSSHFFFHRDFAPTDMAFTTPVIFFTRWITHIGAPVFVFLAGVSIHIMPNKYGDRKAMSRFLLTRGFWLIFLEFTVMVFFWTTHFNVIQLQVLWAIGVSFLFMAFLVFLPWKANLCIAIAILALINLQDFFDWDNTQGFWVVLRAIFLNPGNFDITPTFKLDFFYTVMPYVGMMLLGFCMGRIFGFTYQRRKRILLVSGTLMLLTFLVLRTFNLYGDPYQWSVQEQGAIYTLMSFLNITKYPTSLQFVLFTIGVSLILLIVLERESDQWMKRVRITGQVAMFYYLFHIPFIRVLGKAYHVVFEKNPSYPIFYLMTIIIVIILIFISQKYASFKFSKKNNKAYWWLRYL